MVTTEPSTHYDHKSEPPDVTHTPSTVADSNDCVLENGCVVLHLDLTPLENAVASFCLFLRLLDAEPETKNAIIGSPKSVDSFGANYETVSVLCF